MQVAEELGTVTPTAEHGRQTKTRVTAQIHANLVFIGMDANPSQFAPEGLLPAASIKGHYSE
jgi:hypothetical protein